MGGQGSLNSGSRLRDEVPTAVNIQCGLLGCCTMVTNVSEKPVAYIFYPKYVDSVFLSKADNPLLE
jgi:hypothetical protein